MLKIRFVLAAASLAAILSSPALSQASVVGQCAQACVDSKNNAQCIRKCQEDARRSAGRQSETFQQEVPPGAQPDGGGGAAAQSEAPRS